MKLSAREDEVYIKNASNLSKLLLKDAEKGDKCKKLEQIQFKSTKMILMKC